MPIAGHKRHAFTGVQQQHLAGLKLPRDAIAQHGAAGRSIKTAIRRRTVKLDRHCGTAAIDNVFGLQLMAVHQADLILARNLQLFGVTHAPAAFQIFLSAIAQGEQEHPKCRKIALTVIGDVPPHAA